MAQKLTLKLTADELSILADILNSTKDCMEYDDFTDSYIDGGKFILSLTKSEYEVLTKLDLYKALK